MTADKKRNSASIAFIGFGEAGQAIVKGWGDSAAGQVAAYDIKTDAETAAIRDAKRADYARSAVAGCATLAEALSGARSIFSTVTADQAVVAAQAAAGVIGRGALFLDCNSCSPGAKQRSAAAIEAAGARYVDTAVMAPVHPKLHRTPLLLSGPHVGEALQVLGGLGMDAKATEGPVGAASAIKMIRSVMVKGMEALFLECVLAGRKAGVDATVLASLDASFPGFGFKERAGYMMSRAVIHGVRRAAEMEEVVNTLRELGFDGRMSEATTRWQRQIGELGLDTASTDPAVIADLLLPHLLSGMNDREQ